MALWIHAFCNFLMFGLIIYVQLVHYPSFKYIHRDNFKEFCLFHQTRTTLIVLPLMFLELITAFMLFDYQVPFNFNSILVYINLLIWCSTFLLSVPIHSKLTEGKNDYLIEKLVLTNISRTILWGGKSIVIILIIRGH